RCLLLDCRPFLAHSAGHIRGALNVRCNTIVRRRAKGAVSLEQILPAEGEVRARLRAGLYAAVVVYDERSARAEALRDDSTVALVAALPPRLPAASSREAPGSRSGCLPAGGYERFSSEYPEFCSQSKSLSSGPGPAGAEGLDLGCSSCGTPLHDQAGPVEILPFLYLGSAYHAARRDMLDALGITALLNVSPDCPNHFEGHYEYKSIPVEDNHKADISSWFMEAIEFIGEGPGGRAVVRVGMGSGAALTPRAPVPVADAVQERRGRVLVHCQAGISRSATICLAYLMMKQRVRLDEAFEFVKQRRSVISPNFSFMGQLLQFEAQVLATSCAAAAASPPSAAPAAPFVFSFPVAVPGSLPY
ncbi:DUS4 phosphatase, partial [Nothoprocta pentlandii]|nr:DUS4 phosphatase [Nothoprocta pentlandii]